jgi:hypothetical protein
MVAKILTNLTTSGSGILAILVNDVKQLFGKNILLYDIQDGDGNRNHEVNWLFRQKVEPKGDDDN